MDDFDNREEFDCPYGIFCPGYGVLLDDDVGDGAVKQCPSCNGWFRVSVHEHWYSSTGETVEYRALEAVERTKSGE